MVIASHLPGTGKADGLLAYFCDLPWWSALLPALLSLLAPASAWGDIYKWTDKQGNTVISNVRPANPDTVTDVELVVKETRPAAQSPVIPSQRVATRTEQMLLDRIDELERRLQTQPYPPQYPPQSPGVSPANYYGGYYPAQPPPPPPPPSSYGSYFPSYYPGYYYPWVPAYSYVVYPARTFVSEPAFGFSRGGSFRGAPIHRGRR